MLLELLWSKHRILEVYLNIIETGDGSYGAEAAARRYFQVSSSALTASQAALLAAVLPNPRAWSPANPTGYLLRRQTWILRQMVQLGPLPDGLSEGGPRPAGSPMTATRPRSSALNSDSLIPASDSDLPDTTLPPPSAPDAGPPFPEVPPENASDSTDGAPPTP